MLSMTLSVKLSHLCALPSHLRALSSHRTRCFLIVYAAFFFNHVANL